MSGRILVADDSPNIREILRISLEGEGYSVLLAGDGEEALTLVGREKPDLLIIDVMMPKANGFQVCRRLKSDPATRDVSMIMLTAKSAQQDAYWGRDCGADEYITKPFSTRDLLTTVGRLLETRVRRQAGRSPGVQEEPGRRGAGGRAGHIAHLDWDPRAMDVFRKKYGEFMLGEAHRLFCAAAGQFLREQGDSGPVEMHDTIGVTVVLGGTAAQAKKTAARLARRLNDVAASLYDSEDRDRGYIPLRDPRTGQEEKLPLLAFGPRIVRKKVA